MIPLQRVTLDSNVLLSALATPHGVSGQLLDAWQDGRFDVILSEYILYEIKRILETKFKLESRFIEEKFVSFYQLAGIVEPAPFLDSRIHENDFPILGTAIAGQVNALVTGDLEILKLKRFHNIRILSPRAFLELLNVRRPKL